MNDALEKIRPPAEASGPVQAEASPSDAAQEIAEEPEIGETESSEAWEAPTFVPSSMAIPPPLKGAAPKPGPVNQRSRCVRRRTKPSSIMADDMPHFKRLLDAGQLLMDELCPRFAGFYRYAKNLEKIAAGIASGEVQVPK